MQWLLRFFNRNERADPNVLAMPIPPDRFAALRPDDQFIVSYPRSGNTWMRHLVRDVIVLSQPDKSEPESIWMLIPDVHIPVHEMDHPAQREFKARIAVARAGSGAAEAARRDGGACIEDARARYLAKNSGKL